MKKYLFAILFIPVLTASIPPLHAQTETAPPTPSALPVPVQYSITEIQNNVLEYSNRWRVVGNVWITSGVVTTLHHISDVVATSDTLTHTRLSLVYDRLKDVVISSGVITTIHHISDVVCSSDPYTHDILDLVYGRLKDLHITSGTLNTVHHISDVVCSSDPVTHGTLGDIYGRLKEVHISSGSFTDSRYGTSLSTGTAGKLFSSTIISPAYRVDGYSFYSLYGESWITTTFTDGELFAPDGIPVNAQLSVPVNSPSFDCNLPSGTTLYYTIRGVIP